MLRSAAGPGVNVRLHDEHRHSCTISNFFLRMPRRVKTRLPQCGQTSGCFDVCGTRAMRGSGDIYNCMCSTYHASRKSEKLRRDIETQRHGFRSRNASRILGQERSAERAVGRRGWVRLRNGMCAVEWHFRVGSSRPDFPIAELTRQVSGACRLTAGLFYIAPII